MSYLLDRDLSNGVVPSTEARKTPLPVFYFNRILHANGKRPHYDELELSSKVAGGAMIKGGFQRLCDAMAGGKWRSSST